MGSLEIAIPSLDSPFQILQRTFVHRDPHCAYWWLTTGTILAKLLHNADYSAEHQYRLLFFYSTLIVPELGRAPGSGENAVKYKSNLVNDPTPVEFSWNWGSGQERPMIRFIIESIGSNAGSDMDPLNELAQDDFLTRIQPLIPGLDLEWYAHFSKHVIPKRMKIMKGECLKSRTYLGFDLDGSDIVLKAYLYPGIMAADTKQTQSEVLRSAISELPEHQRGVLSGFNDITDYIAGAPLDRGLKVELMAIDCLAPQMARIKIYVRSQSLSFSFAKEAMTLGHRIPSVDNKQAFADLEELWNLFLCNDEGKVIPGDSPYNAGVLFYYELRIGRPPVPKLNIPVHYHGASDESVLHKLNEYFAKRRSDPYMARYENILRETYSKDCLATRCGAQTYIGCTIKSGRLHLVSYFSPQIFDRIRYEG